LTEDSPVGTILLKSFAHPFAFGDELLTSIGPSVERPAGTLFGRNTTGGAVLRPGGLEDGFEGDVKLTLGDAQV
jgi:hypothetical protein